jgi:hypothetical protein
MLYSICALALVAGLKGTALAQYPDPELPRVYLDTALPPSEGHVITVNAGDDLQQKIDDAGQWLSSGHVTIRLAAGATFIAPQFGSFHLRYFSNNPNNNWIVIRSTSAAFDGAGLIPPGTRVNGQRADHKNEMAKIRAQTATSALIVDASAHHYRLVGIDVGAQEGVNDLVNMIIPEGDTAPGTMTTDITFDRCYVHGNDNGTFRRGIALNGNSWSVIDSYISNFHDADPTHDSQALLGWSGYGPFKIVNNYIEAASENLGFGGAPPGINCVTNPAFPCVIPSDIEIRHNHFNKPLSWKGVHRVKNHYESKNSRRVLITGNIFENCWDANFAGDGGAQNGESIILKSVGSSTDTEPDCTWCVTEDVTIINNIVRHVAAVVDIVGRESAQVEQNQQALPHTRRIKFENLLAYDVGKLEWGRSGYIYRLFSGARDIKIIHNTAESTYVVVQTEGVNNPNFTFRDNIMEREPYGFHHPACAESAPPNYLLNTLNCGYNPYDFQRNVFVNNSEEPTSLDPSQVVSDSTLTVWYPAPLAYDIATDWNEVQFTDQAHQNYRLLSSSPYWRKATDGTDIGVDQNVIDLATSGVIAGTSGSSLPVLANFSATAATPSPRVTLNWAASAGTVHHYQIERSQSGTAFTILPGTTTTTTFTDTTVAANTAYLYRVCAVDAAGNRSLYTNLDLATTVIFADDPLLVAATTVKAQHLTELRQAVNAVRALAGLPAAAWTDLSPAGVVIKAVHLQELRTSLDQALIALTRTTAVYTDPTLTPSTTQVKAVHFQELRQRVK